MFVSWRQASRVTAGVAAVFGKMHCVARNVEDYEDLLVVLIKQLGGAGGAVLRKRLTMLLREEKKKKRRKKGGQAGEGRAQGEEGRAKGELKPPLADLHSEGLSTAVRALLLDLVTNLLFVPQQQTLAKRRRFSSLRDVLNSPGGGRWAGPGWHGRWCWRSAAGCTFLWPEGMAARGDVGRIYYAVLRDMSYSHTKLLSKYSYPVKLPCAGGHVSGGGGHVSTRCTCPAIISSCVSKAWQ